MELLETPSLTIMVGNFQHEIEIMIVTRQPTVQLNLVEHGGTPTVIIRT